MAVAGAEDLSGQSARTHTHGMAIRETRVGRAATEEVPGTLRSPKWREKPSLILGHLKAGYHERCWASQDLFGA